MAYCTQCGAEIPDDARFCRSCGAFQGEQGAARPQDAPVRRVPGVDQDAEDNRLMALLAYLGPLALVPYLAAKQSPFAQYHALRGLNLFLLEVAYGVGAALLSGLFTLVWFRLGLALGLLFNIGWLFFVAMSIIGIVNVCNGEKKDLPLVGALRFIKK